MLSKSQISFVNALHQKKARKEQGLFIVEGAKSVTEFVLSDYSVDTIFHTPQASPKMDKLSRKIKLVEVSEGEMKKMSTLTTPQEVLALVRTPAPAGLAASEIKGHFTLVLDGVQDPGNLGTIIRTADWFGITDIVCSQDTVEAYNPKVVQATMGSLSRMKIHYTDLNRFLSENNLPVYGALLEGESIYEVNFGTEGLIVLGNEGKGITREVQEKITRAVTIPRFGHAESLNVAISAAIFCSEIKRI